MFLTPYSPPSWAQQEYRSHSRHSWQASQTRDRWNRRLVEDPTQIALHVIQEIGMGVSLHERKRGCPSKCRAFFISPVKRLSITFASCDCYRNDKTWISRIVLKVLKFEVPETVSIPVTHPAPSTRLVQILKNLRERMPSLKESSRVSSILFFWS